MRRMLFDTNVYTSLLKDMEEGKKIVVKLLLQEGEKTARVYGFEIVRKELKGAPRITTHYSKNLMADLLRLYENVIAKEYRLEQGMMDLAVAYYQRYRALGGGIRSEDILKDFLIIACASLKELDIVVSSDKKSMLNEYAMRSYAKCNAEQGLKMPRLLTYDEFKREVRMW